MLEFATPEDVLNPSELRERIARGLLAGTETFRAETGEPGDVADRTDGDSFLYLRGLGAGILEGAELGVTALCGGASLRYGDGSVRDSGAKLWPIPDPLVLVELFHLGLSDGGLNCRRNCTGAKVGEMGLGGCASGEDVALVPKKPDLLRGKELLKSLFPLGLGVL